MLTLAMPQSEPSAAMKRSASRTSSGEDRRRKTLRHRVVQLDRLVEVVVGEHVEDRRERLAVHQLGLRGHPHHRRGDVVGVRRRDRDARRRTPRRPRRGPVPARRPCRGRPSRGSAGRRGCRRPQGRRPAAAGRPTRSARRAMSAIERVHDQPAQRGTALTRGARGGEHDAANGQIEIRRRRDDRGVVAAEFQQHPAEPLRHPRADLLAHPHRTRSRSPAPRAGRRPGVRRPRARP